MTLRQSPRIAVAGLVAVAWPLGIAAANGPAFMAGDVIVKFREGSEHAGPVERAVRNGVISAEAQAVATQLAAGLGVPVRAARVTSGRELVLSIDRAELAQTLARSAARDPAVRRARPLPAPPSVLPPTRVALAIDLRRGSEAQRQVAAAAQAGGRLTPQVTALVERLAGNARPPPACRIAGRDRLVLTVDVAALTRDLVDRLGRRPDVEYAQTSQLVKPQRQ